MGIGLLQWILGIRRQMCRRMHFFFRIRVLTAWPYYPKTPMPNNDVHRIENPTRTIIQISSFFMMHSPLDYRLMRGLKKDGIIMPP